MDIYYAAFETETWSGIYVTVVQRVKGSSKQDEIIMTEIAEFVLIKAQHLYSIKSHVEKKKLNYSIIHQNYF